MATGGGEDASVDVVESKKGSLYIVDDDKRQAPMKSYIHHVILIDRALVPQ